MNYSKAVFLINDNVRAVIGTYEAHEGAPQTVFKSFDQSLKESDYVIVPTDTRHKMTVVKIVGFMDVLDVDLESSTQVAWIIGKVNLADYSQILSEEEAAIQAIKSAEKLKKRNELRAALLADGAEKIKGLPISFHGGVPAIEEDDAA